MMLMNRNEESKYGPLEGEAVEAGGCKGVFCEPNDIYE